MLEIPMSQFNWNAPGWRVIVKPHYIKDVDLGDGRTLQIVQPDRTGIAATTKGTVIAVGDAAYKDARFAGPWCKPGDVVVYARYGGVIFEEPDTGEKFICLNDEDIVLVQKNDKT